LKLNNLQQKYENFWFQVSGFKFQVQGSKFQVPSSRFKGIWFTVYGCFNENENENLSSKFQVPSSRFKEFKVQGSRFQVPRSEKMLKNGRWGNILCYQFEKIVLLHG